MKHLRMLTAAIVVAEAALSMLHAEPAVVVLRSSSGVWDIQTATKVLINGKNKIRVAGPGQTGITSEEFKRAPESIVGSVVLRANHAGYLMARAGAGWTTVIPEGSNLKESTSAAMLWGGARVQFVTPESKGQETPTTTVFAILPGENTGDAIAAFVEDEANFTGVGEKDAKAAFEERMSLLVYAAKSPTAASPRLKNVLLLPMTSGLQKAKDGTVKYSDLERALLWATYSEAAFPNDAQQRQARDQLRERKAWIDRRAAILRAFAAGMQYDAFIDKYTEFEYYDSAFPEVKALRVTAIQKSVDQHVSEADRLIRDQQLEPALHELKLALLRKPGDVVLEEKLEDTRLSEARQHAKTVRKKAKDATSPAQVRLARHLAFAQDAVTQGKLAEAKKELDQAELIDKESPEILLAKAKLLEAESDLAGAIAMLDAYDRLVIEDEDIKKGDALRTEVMKDSRKRKVDLGAQIDKAEKEGDFTLAHAAAIEAAKTDPENPEFLYSAGVTSLITRHDLEAKGYLTTYLKVSAPLIAQSSRRAEVGPLLASLASGRAAVSPPGPANWFSGYAAPAGVFYCPMSLMPNAHPVEVRGSRKLSVTYDWQDEQLRSVKTVTMDPGENQSQVYFEYFGPGKGVRRLSPAPITPDAASSKILFTSSGAVGPGTGSYTGLFNHPEVNPYVVERLLNRRVGTIVSGNSYFHPFVWDGVHTFLAEYDADGRVRSAQEIHTKERAPIFEFHWEGNKLTSISERGVADGYKREMHYEGNQIIDETIVFRGRNSRIEYKYKGDHLLEADCDIDPSIDNQRRKVTFR